MNAPLANTIVYDPADDDQDSEIKIMPSDIQTEQGLLGAILMNNDCFHRVADILQPEHFYEGLHEQIYAKCMDLLNNNNSVSPITINVFFKDNETIQQIGGAKYFAKLAQEGTSSYNVRNFAKTIVECSERSNCLKYVLFYMSFYP